MKYTLSVTAKEDKAVSKIIEGNSLLKLYDLDDKFRKANPGFNFITIVIDHASNNFRYQRTPKSKILGN